MLTQEERQAKAEMIRQLPSQLEHEVKGLNDEQLDTPYRDGGWTVRQVVHHLADSHMNAFIRMKLVLTEDHPTLRPYLQDEWAKLPDTAKLPIASSLTIIEGLHARWSDLLKNVGESEWRRGALHPEAGEMTLDDLLRTYAGHGVTHLGQITALKKSKGW